MSAPEPQVRVRMYTREWKGRTEYGWTCDGCGWFPYAFWTLDSAPPPSVELHNTNCRELALARLQARWDARDKALRTLVTEWREQASHSARALHDQGHDYDIGYLRARNVVWAAAADALDALLPERAR